MNDVFTLITSRVLTSTFWDYHHAILPPFQLRIFLLINYSKHRSDEFIFQKMIQRLSSKVIRILANNPSPMTHTGTNCYLIGSGSSRILIDTGSPDDESCSVPLLNLTKSENCTVDKIICTHWHPDHTGGIDSILRVL